MIFRRTLRGPLCTVAIASSAFSVSVYGQTRSDEADTGLADIVVTATRREETLQSVPVSVTAISAESLDNAGLATTEQLSQVTPNLVVVQQSTQTQFNLRGVSSRGVYAGDENGVAVYLDGIYQPLPYTSLFDLVEVDRVEVLRGPQGTLFGRNATGGLVNVITPDPKFDAAGHVRLRYGSFNLFQGQAYLTAPITDRVAFDVAGNYSRDGGYVKDLLKGGKLGDRETYTVRSKLLFQLSDSARVVLSAFYSNIDDQSAVLHQPVNGFTAAITIPGTVIPRTPNTAAVNAQFPPYMKNRLFNTSLRSTIELGGVNLEMMGSYSVARTRNFTDFDMTAARIQDISSVQKDKIGLGEIRLVSDNDGALKWTAGIFGYKSNNEYEPLVVNVNGAVAFSHYARNRTMSLAAFAEGTYAVSDQFNITAGGRYSTEQRKFNYARTRAAGTAINDAEKKWNSFTPRVSLQYVFSPRANVYASWSKGFKSGLFDTPSTSLVAIDPEKLDTYEIGLKTDPSRFLRFNMSAFLYKYKDLQVTGLDPDSGTSRLLNAGRSTIYGLEAELIANPTKGLTLRATGGYLHTKFDSFPNATVTVRNPATGRNISVNFPDPRSDVTGKRLLRAPTFNGTLGVDYTSATAVGQVGVSGNLYYSSRYYFEPAYRLSQKPYAMINSQVWIEPLDQFRVSLWVENLADALVTRSALPTGPGDYATYQKPRTFGVTVDKRF